MVKSGELSLEELFALGRARRVRRADARVRLDQRAAGDRRGEGRAHHEERVDRQDAPHSRLGTQAARRTVPSSCPLSHCSSSSSDQAVWARERLAQHVVDADERLWLSRSWTTRARRPSESGDEYDFVDRATFERPSPRAAFSSGPSSTATSTARRARGAAGARSLARDRGPRGRAGSGRAPRRRRCS